MRKVIGWLIALFPFIVIFVGLVILYPVSMLIATGLVIFILGCMFVGSKIAGWL